MSEHDNKVENHIKEMLRYLVPEVDRPGLRETPHRVRRAWRHFTSGYDKDPADILKVFEDGSEGYDQLVLVKDIPVYSQCEHHMLPFFGVAHVAYIPNGSIVGLSKLSRLVDVYARRLQVQERLTNEIAEALDMHLKPQGVGVILQCRHLCMESRGICKQGHTTITSSLRGALLHHTSTRVEFMELIK